jgi:hypothetical protein
MSEWSQSHVHFFGIYLKGTKPFIATAMKQAGDPRGGRMNNDAMKEVLNELFSQLERLETQNEAILQFLKEKKRVTDKQLAPYLEQAGNASNVKWRAARVRIDHLLEPEHPEKEIKLGKKPELHEESSTVSSEEKRSASADKEGKRADAVDKQDKRGELKNEKGNRAELGDLLSGNSDQRNKDKSEADEVKAHAAEVKAEKPEVRSDSATGSKEVAAQAKDDEKPDAEDARHPMEATQPPTEQESAETAAQLKSDKTDSGKEAA